MFEAAEVGHEVGKKEFEKAVLPLRTRLLKAQLALREAKFPVIVIVSGVETAGKSEVVNRLTEWLDTRGVQTVAFWDESDEERERPPHWRFWRRLPGRGTIGILFGSWYTRPIVQRVLRDTGRKAYEAALNRVARLENMLADDGAVLVKLWFHISRKEQSRRLERLRREHDRKLTPYEKDYAKLYRRFARVSEIAIRATDQGYAPWHIVDAQDHRYRDLMAGRILLDAMERGLARKRGAALKEPRATHVEDAGRHASVLTTLDLRAKLAPARYEQQMEKFQARLSRLAWKLYNRKRSTVILFEGSDAAGKGGAIRRVVKALDARLLRVMPIAAPTDEERAHHYLWRFWRHLPRAGYFTIYDRSWYGRVLVERVEGFARPDEWGRAYEEITDFEEQLTEHGITLCKFWLQITPREQLRRFKEREVIAYKQHKITAEDWRNRGKWDAYEAAVDEMVARTSTEGAPWTLVAANDKRHARVEVLKTLCGRIEETLDRG
jgi:polyphosphate:AMP phosphotransferase